MDFRWEYWFDWQDGKKFMNESSDQQVSSSPAYLIISCNTVEELAGKVSKALAGGTMFLHGHPFVFKDQVCQALKLLSQG
jgi:hypothetical protein